jgi:hypothetical protein
LSVRFVRRFLLKGSRQLNDTSSLAPQDGNQLHAFAAAEFIYVQFVSQLDQRALALEWY